MEQYSTKNCKNSVALIIRIDCLNFKTKSAHNFFRGLRLYFLSVLFRKCNNTVLTSEIHCIVDVPDFGDVRTGSSPRNARNDAREKEEFVKRREEISEPVARHVGQKGKLRISEYTS